MLPTQSVGSRVLTSLRSPRSGRAPSVRDRRTGGTVLVGALVVTALAAIGGPAGAAEATVELGSAESFAVLAGTEVTSSGGTAINGNVGVSAGTLVSGFPPGTVTGGAIHRADSLAAAAQASLIDAYDDAAGRTTSPPPDGTIVADLGGQTKGPGVYSGGSLAINGTLTLDANNDPNAVFIFRSASDLITGTSSRVALIRGANPCNIFWQVTSSAALGTDSQFSGSILALTSITLEARAAVQGRLLARNGNVTMLANAVDASACQVTPPTTTTTSASTTTTTASTTSTGPATSTTSADATSTTAAATPPGGGSPPGDGPPGDGTPTTRGDGSGNPRLPATGNRTAPLAALVGGLLLLAGGLVLWAGTRRETIG